MELKSIPVVRENLLEKYLTHIQKSAKRTHLYIGDDALFLTIRRKTVIWGEIGKKKKEYKKETVILVLMENVYRLEVIDSNYQPYLNKILSKIKYGSIDSRLSLVHEMGKFYTRYGVNCIKMTETKLDYYLKEWK